MPRFTSITSSDSARHAGSSVSRRDPTSARAWARRRQPGAGGSNDAARSASGEFLRSALPPIVARVGARVPVLVDGGIRRGTDVIKALALGASGVQIGRPHVYGLAVAGAEGVAHVVRVLRQELLMAMALMGCRTIADITRDAIWNPSALKL